MREHGVPQFTVDGHRPVVAFDVLGISFATELGYTNMLSILDLAGIPLHAADRDDEPPDRPRRRARGVQPGADRRLRRRRGAGRRRGGRRRDHRRRQGGEGRRGSGARETLRAARRDPRASTCPALYDVSYGEDGAIAAVTPLDGASRAHPQAHHHRPRRLAVPEGAAGPDGRDRPRADERRDLPRLHPRLPLLPGRDDHPAGARAVAARASARWSSRACEASGYSTRSACSRCRAPTTPTSARSPRTSPTATRAPAPASRCRARASTRSTSTSPRSSPATAAAPASPSPPRAGRSGSAG